MNYVKELLMRRSLVNGVTAFVVLVVFFLGMGSARAERAASSLLLPKETLAYIRLAHVPEFAQRFRATAFGRMLSDPQMKPLIDHLYGQAVTEVDQFKEQIGLSLTELLEIPQGEIALAIVPVTEQAPAIVLVVDTAHNTANAKKFLETLEKTLNNPNRREDQIEGQTVVVFNANNGMEIGLFEREGTYVVVSNVAIAGELIKNWKGREKDSLNDNPRYAAVMSACRAKDSEPQFVWYAEPIDIAKAYLANDFGARIALATLPALGLDGLKAVGGSMALGVGEFDFIGHAHLLLDNPRAGVIEVLQLAEGDLKPQPWVPSDASSYMTLYWDFLASYNQLEKLIDSFQTPGFVADNVKKNISDKLEVDIVNELIPLLAGRMSLVTRMPNRNQGLAVSGEIGEGSGKVTLQIGRGPDQLVAIEVKDLKKAQTLLDRVLAKPEFGDKIVKKSWAGHDYYTGKPRERLDGDGNSRQPNAEPCFALSHDCLLISDQLALMQSVLGSREEKDSLGAALDYKLMSSKILRHSGDGRVGMISFNRPDEGLRYMWDIAVQEQTKARLEKAAENNKFFSNLDSALKQHPLPPFSAVEKYFSPTGAILTNEESGFHYLTFTLKRKME
jgi:hypothetical protein